MCPKKFGSQKLRPADEKGCYQFWWLTADSRYYREATWTHSHSTNSDSPLPSPDSSTACLCCPQTSPHSLSNRVAERPPGVFPRRRRVANQRFQIPLSLCRWSSTVRQRHTL